MTTFDSREVRRFAAHLNAEMDRCDNGEGHVCATLDAALSHYADLCFHFVVEVRQWAMDVFGGRVEFDPNVEKAWREEVERIYKRAKFAWEKSRIAEVPCYTLDGQDKLGNALLWLQRYRDEWVTPQLSVGPTPRLGFPLGEAASEKVRQQLASLPPLPADWMPEHPQQRARFLRMRKR